VALAKQAGMKYIVITSKHHDGFAMFRSRTDPFNIYDATPFKHDPLKELVGGRQEGGHQLGFYYSQAQDWNHRGGAAAGGHWDRGAGRQHGRVHRQGGRPAGEGAAHELRQGGGAVVGHAGGHDARARRQRFLPLLKLQPDIVTNNRLWKTKSGGDFETPEQKIPANGIAGKDWETCMTINGTWGFRTSDQNWKTTETLVRNLVDIASKGGNFLLNVGPTAEGVIPAPSIERLQQMGAW
jgi:alpha-L-fucosidase